MAPIIAVLRAVASAESFSIFSVSLPFDRREHDRNHDSERSGLRRGRKPAVDRAEHEAGSGGGRRQINDRLQLLAKRNTRPRRIDGRCGARLNRSPE